VAQHAVIARTPREQPALDGEQRLCDRSDEATRDCSLTACRWPREMAATAHRAGRGTDTQLLEAEALPIPAGVEG